MVTKFVGKMTERGWIVEDNRRSLEYNSGVDYFLECAAEYVDTNGRVKCPCKRCNNFAVQTLTVIEAHLFDNGFSPMYRRWIHHGEELDTGQNQFTTRGMPGDNVGGLRDDDMFDALEDIVGMEADDGSEMNHGSDGHKDQFEDLFAELNAELWPGCTEYSSLTFIVTLMHLKVMHKWTNKSFDQLLKVLKKSHPQDNNIPISHYEAKAKLRNLGMGYECIDVCKHHCALFWSEYARAEKCPICGFDRWKKKASGRKVAHKVLRYFPLKDRLKRLFGSRHTAGLMRWHDRDREVEEGVLRHPADGQAWKHLDSRFPDFASDPRNVRLGLAADGFNPFGNMSHSYSMWPVVLTTYNLPPWLCMNAHNLMLTLLIPGKNSPGKDIDVFLRPLIEELKELWNEGMLVKDASDGTQFQMRAALLWTINDYPAKSSLSGWSGQGYLACSTCNKETPSLKISGKVAYYDHRRFLPEGHRMRKSKHYKIRTERRTSPKILDGEDQLRQLEAVPEVCPGKHPDFGLKKRKRGEIELNWTKKSIFWELPYWKTLLLRHNLDVMHIEKNVADNVIGTLLSIEGKNKDTDNARRDLKELGIKPELHLYEEGGRLMKPFALYTLTQPERRIFIEFLKSVKFPDGFAGNLQNNVTDDGKLTGLKSHDCHVIMQRLLIPGIRSIIKEKHTKASFSELSDFFRLICSRTLKMEDLYRARDDVIVLLCKLEQILPPAFFTIMVHLIIHLPEEAMQGGPVHMRWMYPFERYLGTLKHYVRNRARPEGSIAEAYVVNEALTFCSRYLGDSVETRFNMPDRIDDAPTFDTEDRELSVFRFSGRLSGQQKVINMEEDLRDKAEWYILNNCPEVDKYIQ